MAPTQAALPFPPLPESRNVVINGRCSLRLEDEYCVVTVCGLPFHQYSVHDAVAGAYAMVALANAQMATQEEIGRAFRCSARTVRRHQQRYARGGMAALATRCGWHPGRRRLPPWRLRLIVRLKDEGLSNRAIAHRLGVTEKAIRKQVGPSQDGEQRLLPFEIPVVRQTTSEESALTPRVDQEPSGGGRKTPSEGARAPDAEATQGAVCDRGGDDEPLPLSLDSEPCDRSLDRTLACQGLLDDAAPVFGDATAVPAAGVLLAVPALVASGLLQLARVVYGPIGPAFYGLRTTLLVLLSMALWRITRPEALKERDPAHLGRVLGLDRVPEVKTLRRKLTRLAAFGHGQRLGAELARQRVAQRGGLMGFLYVDGHVRVYHGARTIPKTHVARMRISLPATTDYWVNDQAGDPLFVVTAAANAGMVAMLPQVLGEIRQLIGERRITIVFDRGGWSPKLFKTLIDAGFDILTYRKGTTQRLSEERFVLRQAQLDGREVSFRLCEQEVSFLEGTLLLRQVTRLTDTGHQTPVLTSRRDLTDLEVAYRMFERWRQENFFKYMRQQFLLDALSDYQVEPDDPTRTVPNPQRRIADKEVRAARTEVARLEQAYGAAADTASQRHCPTMDAFKSAHEPLATALHTARAQLKTLMATRRELPKRVEVHDLSEGTVVKLATERKHLTNLIKMVAFQAESDLLALLRPHYARADDEGRTLLHELFHSAADLQVSDTDLTVTLAPLSSPHRTHAVKSICQLLNDTHTTFPGSLLQLRFAVHSPPVRGLAFPGPRPPCQPLPPPNPTAQPDNSSQA